MMRFNIPPNVLDQILREYLEDNSDRVLIDKFLGRLE